MPGSPGIFKLYLLNDQPSIQASFKKNERLKSRSTILSIFTLNKNVRLYPFKIVWLVEPVLNHFTPKIGVSVSKRNYKKAVQRNFIKRRMREVFRLNKQILYSNLNEHNIHLACMIIYTGKEILSYDEMERKIKKLFIRLNRDIMAELDNL